MTTPGFTLQTTNWRHFAFAMDKVAPERANAAFVHSPLLAAMASETLVENTGQVPLSGMGRVVHQGGPRILRFVTLGKHAGAARVSGGFGHHNLAPDDNDRPSEENWTFYNHALVVSEHDLEVTRGETEIASLVDRQMTNVMRSTADLIADDLYALTVAPNALTSVPALINANDTAQGLSGATFDKWNARGLSTVGTVPGSVSFTAGSFVASGMSNMRRLVNNAEEGGVRPNALFTEYVTHERYESSLQPQERFAGAVRVADGSFPALAFRTIPVIPDRKCTAGHMFALSLGDRENGVQMDFLEGAAFQFSDWKPGQSQTVMIRPLRATCNVSIGNRQFGNNKMNGITD